MLLLVLLLDLFVTFAFISNDNDIKSWLISKMKVKEKKGKILEKNQKKKQKQRKCQSYLHQKVNKTDLTSSNIDQVEKACLKRSWSEVMSR